MEYLALSPMRPPLIDICTSQSGPRLRFVLDWLFKERLGLDYRLVQEATGNPCTVSYGAGPAGMVIPDAGLLWETGIRQREVAVAVRDGLFTLFPAPDAAGALPFDLFSAIFYLLSRYEEYGEYIPDRHGRYTPAASILRDVLERPVIDEWVARLRQLLQAQWRLHLPQQPGSFLPTYDIDIAWSYKHKGLKRWLGAGMKELLSGRLSGLAARCRVGLGSAKDPYDAFERLRQWHRQHGLRPLYFILAAPQATAFDKNIPLRHPAMKALVSGLAQEGGMGIHPSYFTKGDPQLLQAEQALLAGLTGQPVTASRQHFIRLFFPDTYQLLLDSGIRDDYSMGYATSLGFRAGTSHSFCWYDLRREQQTPLRIHPFCFMDTTAHFDLHLSVQEAFGRLMRMEERLAHTGGRLITIFHNFSLGTDPAWKGWPEAYAAFLEQERPALPQVSGILE